MTRALLGCLLTLLLALDAAARPPLRDAQLLRILPPAALVRGGFDAVEEMPVDPAGDPDLAGWGVHAQRARHYTRSTPPANRGVQVCSVEVWSFADEARAEAALAGFRYAGWEFAQRGSVLLMARGLTRAPGRAAKRAVFPECRAILERALTRAPR